MCLPEVCGSQITKSQHPGSHGPGAQEVTGFALSVSALRKHSAGLLGYNGDQRGLTDEPRRQVLVTQWQCDVHGQSELRALEGRNMV